MPRLPQPDGDAGRWGTVLNEFLEVEHNADGTLKDVARQADLTTLQSNLQNLEQDVHSSSLTIGTVTTGMPAANITGSVPNRTLNLTLPDGNLPVGGTAGQVLAATSASSPTWQDIPGIAYPSLLLSPDGSFDRDGVVTPTVGANVTVVAGQYGNAWRSVVGENNNAVSIPHSSDIIDAAGQWTVISRHRTGGSAYYAAIGPSGTSGLLVGPLSFIGGVSRNSSNLWPADDWLASAVVLREDHAVRYVNGVIANSWSPRPTPAFGNTIRTYASSGSGYAITESVLIYPLALSDAEINRISNLPAAWTMQNAAVNIYQPVSQFGLFVPGKKLASGSTTLRNAPGTGSDTIATLSANTLIEVSQAMRTVSSVDYALVKIQTGETGWVPVGQITDL